MPAPAEISQLVELFERNYDQYRAPAFSEAALHHQFVDTFFITHDRPRAIHLKDYPSP